MAVELDGAVALITGGANGIGAAAARRLAARGARVEIADVDERGAGVAADIGGTFTRCDVRNPADNDRAVAVAVAAFGGLDLAFLNAGVSTTSVALASDSWDPDAYRRAFAINVDGVFFGVNAALPALRARGRGALVLTSSLAGLTGVPQDPIYAATKHAVVGLARSLGPALAAEHVAVNALCPGFADTAINEPVRQLIDAAGIPLMPPDDVVDALFAILASDVTGQAWYVQPGRPAEPFAFRHVPGPRAPDGTPVGGIPGLP